MTKNIAQTLTALLCLCGAAQSQTTEIWDANYAPKMVVIPAGEFMMGSPDTEANRQPSESPRHRVTIGKAFAVGKYNVTRAEFAAFVAATGHNATADGCYLRADNRWTADPRANWKSPGFKQTDSDPAICLTWEDASAYAAWLSKKTGHHYRLLSEAEFEYAARAGTTTPYYWGEDAGKMNANCNGCGSQWDFKQTSPAGSFPANAFGLYDMSGNAWSWVADCWNPNYNGAPADGSAWSNSGDCVRHMRRGGSWEDDTRYARSANRSRYPIADRYTIFGFRVARKL